MSSDKLKLTFVLLYYWMYLTRLRPAFYLFFSTRVKHSMKHEHLCKILYFLLFIQIIQKHINGGEDFDKTWKDYEEGFGDDLSNGYWIGKIY